jgi:hypothetical protein
MEEGMPTTEQRKLTVDTEHFSILNITPPFVDICLQSTLISPREFLKIAQIVADYPNDARLIEMVRNAGDASGKVPYLLDVGETPASILPPFRKWANRASVFKICRTHSDHHLLLLSLAVPTGCEAPSPPRLKLTGCRRK